jgi:diguanylate cyclase (GGDEF)-like protein/PAS domain S-box-containing protein
MNSFDIEWFYPYSTEFQIRFSLSFLCIAIINYFYERFRYSYKVRIEEQNRKLNVEIVERAKAESALRASEEKYRTIYFQAAEGIIVLDTKGRVLEANPQMSRMLGIAGDDLVGINVHSLIHPDDLRETPSQIPRILRGETIMIERRLRTSSGDYRLFEQSGRMVDRDRLIYLYRDITERKEQELALANANRELNKLANLDGLTQIANRRRFETALDAEWKRLGREKQPLSIILGDIDYFKQFNDLYGHQAGDTCLIAVARAFECALQRPADLAARWGGEEFIVLLPNTDGEGGFAMAEKIRRMVEEMAIPHRGSDVASVVTMSLGVSTAVPDRAVDGPEALVAAADRALYLAKHGGRNRSVAH